MSQPVALSFAAYKRSGFPEAVTVNCYAEKAPTSQSQPLALIARPGMEAFAQVGSAQARAIFQKAGLFNDSALILTQTTLSTLTASGVIATMAGVEIDGSGSVDIDAGQDADLNSVAYIATGTGLYKLVSGTITREPFPAADDDVGASAVCFHRGFWVAVRAGSDTCYFQLPGETTWAALNFFSAEYAPDPLVAVRSVGDIMMLLGNSTVEAARLSGTADAFQPYEGLNFDHGCRSRDTAVKCQDALIYVDDDCQVRLFEGGVPRIVSDNGLAEQIRGVGAMDLRASFWMKDGHPFYVLTLGTEATWGYDLSTEMWVRFSSLGFDYWRTQLFCNIGDIALAADSASNQIYRLDPDRRTDGDDTFTVRFRAFQEALQGSIPCANVQLSCDLGNAPYTGQGSAPVIVMRMSDNQGKTFGRPRERSMGATGEYLIAPRWVGLGTVKSPHGRVFDFEISDPVGRRFSGLMMNAE